MERVLFAGITPAHLASLGLIIVAGVINRNRSKIKGEIEGNKGFVISSKAIIGVLAIGFIGMVIFYSFV